MSKRHKLFWTGVDIETSLSPDRVWLAVAAALAQTKGKKTLVSDAPLLREYEMKGSETLFASAPELTFDVQVSDEASGRRAVRTHILRALLKDGSIPFGPKTMLGQKAYMKFARALGDGVADADPTASVALREGPMPDGFPLDGLTAAVESPR